MNRAKYVIVALAPIVLIVGVWMSMRGGAGALPSSYRFVDIETGEVVSIAKDKVQVIPAIGASGKPTLYPVSTEEDGSLVIGERYRDGVLEYARTNPVKVDTTTFVIPN